MAHEQNGNGRWRGLAQALMGAFIVAVVSSQVYLLTKVIDISERISAGRAERVANFQKHEAELRGIREELRVIQERMQRRNP